MDYDPASDLRALEAMASNLTPYLYEKELYGVISNDLPRLTVGGLLMRLHRLEGLKHKLSEEQRQRLHDARLNFEQLRSEWRSHYEDKVVQELNARLNNFSAFLEDYTDDQQRARSAYPAEATHRIIIEQLRIEAEELELWEETEIEDKLYRLDRRLRGILDRNNKMFVPPNGLQEVYPEEQYWWLYAYPEVDN
jgi:hypothetical protein